MWVTVLDASGQIISFVDDVHFGGAIQGESFGRYPDAVGRLTTMQQVTMGDVNSSPRVGPLVFSEVQYNPGAPSNAALAIDPQITDDDLEFVEIVNPTMESVSLAGWQIRGGIDFDFESASPVDLGPGQTLLVLPFNPTSASNAHRLDAFQVHYGIDETVMLVGGYDGQLGNGGDLVRLERAVAPPPDDPEETPTVTEDEVLYDDLLPWPTEADGTGQSLQRRRRRRMATMPFPGLPPIRRQDDCPLRGDFDGNGIVDAADINLLFVQLRSPTPDLRYDLTDDGLVNDADRDEMIYGILDSTYGDANLDRVFDSLDFALVFQAGEYEDNIPGNSLWETGDWDGNGEFDSLDFVLSFQTGDYEQAVARPHSVAFAQETVPLGAALHPVPEAAVEPSPAASIGEEVVPQSPSSTQQRLIDAALESLFDDDPELGESDSLAIDDLMEATEPARAI